MAQLKNVVEPFGEVNVYEAASGRKRVVATILMEPHKEGTQTGIALDGSGSMAKLYGVEDGSRVLSPIFGGPKKLSNEVTPVAQKLCAYLARRIDADGGTTCIYWAVGQGGGEIEVIGDMTAAQAETRPFGPPKEFGTGTQLLPAVRYFVDRFRTAPWGIYVFITDGELHDLDQVIAYSVQLAREIAAHRRNPLKFVLIGLGPDVNETQMTELDDLDSGTEVDLWDHKLAAEMRRLEEIFAEVVDKNARVADNGRIFDPQGRVVRDYSVGGLPAFMEFEIGADADYFTLDVNGTRVNQPLRDGAPVPREAAPTTPVSTSTPAPMPAPPAPAAASSPLPGAAKTPTAKEPGEMDDVNDPDGEWKNLPLELGQPGDQPTDVGLEKQED
jgi:hypothetical protein